MIFSVGGTVSSIYFIEQDAFRHEGPLAHGHVPHDSSLSRAFESKKRSACAKNVVTRWPSNPAHDRSADIFLEKRENVQHVQHPPMHCLQYTDAPLLRNDGPGYKTQDAS